MMVKQIKLITLMCFLLLFAVKATANCGVSQDLESGDWAQIGLPCVPPDGENTVAAIFGDDFGSLASYGTQWAVYSYDSQTNAYEDLGLNGIMSPGKAYWVLNGSDETKTVSMPPNSQPVAPVMSAECPAANSTCVDVALDYASERLGEVQFNMVSFPRAEDVNWGEIGVADDTACSATNASDVNPGTGCSLDEAQARSILRSSGWKFNGTAYDTVAGGSSISPWEGMWVAI